MTAVTTGSAGPAVKAARTSVRPWDRPGLVRLRREGGIPPIVAFVVFMSVYVAINPDLLTRFQLQIAANLVVPLALVALGQLLVVLVGGIDISIGAVMSLSNVVFATQLESVPVPVAVLMAVAVGVGCGLLNGALVAYAGLPAIAVTLATAFIFGSLAREVLDRPGGAITEGIYLATSGELVPYVPVALVWLAAVAVLLWFLLQRTALGRHVYGVGSSPDSVRAAGLDARRTQLIAFGIAGALTSFGAMMLASSTVTGDPRSGDPYLLSSIAAVALAGAAFSGGRGSIVGTVLAAITLGLIGNLLFFAGINSYWQYVVSALIIVAVVGLPEIWSKTLVAIRGVRA